MPRRYEMKVDRINIDVEEFRDFNELLRVCDERNQNEWAHGDGAREATDNSWRGGTYDNARDRGNGRIYRPSKRILSIPRGDRAADTVRLLFLSI